MTPLVIGTSSHSRAALCWLALILVIAGVVRCYELGRYPLSTDEEWTVEISTGRGSLHQHIPSDRVISAPAFFSLADAPPWWRIWSHMEITHPPFYSILLRFWEDVLGDTDANARAFSVAASLIAIGFLFDIVRLQGGLMPAVWAALLMAIAAPEVQYARIVRNYTLLLAVALAVADAVVRIEVLGASRRRIISLGAATLMTLFTHYFSVGALAGVSVYLLWRLPEQRRRSLWAVAVAAMAFVVCWGPFMWRQRFMFATDDPGTLFLIQPDSHHVFTTMMRVLLIPSSQLIPFVSFNTAVATGVGVYLLPLVFGFFAARRSLVFWSCWMIGTIVVVAALDIVRGTNHLEYGRYTLLAGPAFCASIAILLVAPGRRRWLGNLAMGIVVVTCATELPYAYPAPSCDPRMLAHKMVSPPGPRDLLLFSTAFPCDLFDAHLNVLTTARYGEPITAPLAVLTRLPTPEILAAARQARFVFLFTRSGDYDTILPGARVVAVDEYPGFASVLTLRWPKPDRAGSQ